MKENIASISVYLWSSPLAMYKLCVFSHYVQLFAIPWIAAHQDPLPMGFPRQECWSWLPFLFPGIIATQGSNLQVL